MHPLVIALVIATPADTLPVPDTYRDALLAGTRSRAGASGGAYWQRHVEYDIRTRLFPTENPVVGSEEVTDHGQSPVLDPEERFPDMNREDNRWAPGSR